MRHALFAALLLPVCLQGADATGASAAARLAVDYPAAKPFEAEMVSKGKTVGKTVLTFGEREVTVPAVQAKGFGRLPFTIEHKPTPWTCTWHAHAEGANAAGESLVLECMWSCQRVPKTREERETAFTGTISITRKDGTAQVIALSASLPYPAKRCWDSDPAAQGADKAGEKAKKKGGKQP